MEIPVESTVAHCLHLTVLIVIVTVFTGCGHLMSNKLDRNRDTLVTPVIELTKAPGTVFQVAFKDDTVILDSSGVAKSVLAASKDGSMYVFQVPPAKLKSLHPGTTVLFSGLALRKIVSVQTLGNLALVATQPADLSDAIREGTMKWDYPINFGEIARKMAFSRYPHRANDPLEAFESWLPGFTRPVLADGLTVTVQHSGSTQGWQYDTTTTVEENHMHIAEVLQRKDAGGMNIRVRAIADLQNFQTFADIEVHDGVITKFVYDNKDVRGTLDFDWAGSKTNSGVGTLQGAEQSLVLPPLAEIPLDVGGFPFTMDVGSQILVRPGFTGNNEMVHGHSTIHFSGDQGFTVTNGLTAPVGAVHGDATIDDDTSSQSAIGPIGFIAAVSIPNLELRPGILSSSLQVDNGAFSDQARLLLQQNGWRARLTDPSVEQGALHSGVYVELITVNGMAASGPLVMLPCEQTTLRLSLKVGGAGNLGVQSNSPSQTYELKVWHRINPPIVNCKEGLEAEGGQEPSIASNDACDTNSKGQATDYFGVPGGSTMQDFKGAFRHKGVDVQKLRDIPVFANLRTSIPLVELNAVRTVRSNQFFFCDIRHQQGNIQFDDSICSVAERNGNGLGIMGSGDAQLKDVQVLVQPWSPKKDPVSDDYGGIVGLASHYQYKDDHNQPQIFTVYLEYEHLITPAYMPRLDNGQYVDNQNNPIAEGSYQGCIGFGSLMQDKTILSMDQLAQHPLIGFLGSTQNPHVHIQAAFKLGSAGYVQQSYFDPGVVLAGH